MSLWDWSDYSGNDDEETLPLLFSVRTQQLVLAAITNMEFRYNWSAVDDATWDDIDEAIGEAYEEIMEAQMPDFTPVGSIVSFAGDEANIPAKWLKCNGATILSSFYPELYAVLPAAMKTATHLTLPDLSHRYIRQAQSDDEIGDFIGSDTHVLTIAEMPSHNHSVATRVNALGSAATAATGNTANSTINTGNQGGGEAHNNMPASQMFYAIIKALP